MDSEVLQCLASSLNADPNARMSAELRLNELFTKPGLWISLIAGRLHVLDAPYRYLSCPRVYYRLARYRRVSETDKYHYLSLPAQAHRCLW